MILIAELYLGVLHNYIVGKSSCERVRLGAADHFSNLFVQDEIMGYSMAKNISLSSKVVPINGDVIHDAVYSTNKYGFRITPPNDNPDAKNILFFGCSFAFGHGINDNETLPYIFQVDGKNEYRAYNFAHGGYGPHQMLRIIESNLIDKICTHPQIAI